MTISEYTNHIKNYFTKYFGTEISKMLQGHPQIHLTVQALINTQADYLVADIKGYNPRFNREKMTEYQSGEFDKALIQQLWYILTEGDFRQMSGYDPMSNSFVDSKALDRRTLAKTAKATLENSGLLYRALNSSGGPFCRGWH